tara:strand:+ start:176625 stop:177050 length:426 start_codon:yes stop_codon:yes gene_type:complete
MGGLVDQRWNDLMIRKIQLSVTAALTTLAISTTASAQTTYPGSQHSVTRGKAIQYEPRPTLSPYLNLLRNDDSVLSPYHSFVVPRRQQQQARQAQNDQIRSLQRRLNHTGQIPGGDRTPTGRGGYFQTYMHYFPQSNVSNR